MSRSHRAWMENCGSAGTMHGVGDQAALEDQARRGRGPLLGAVSSIKCLLQLLFVALLIAATTPATTLAESASGGQAKSQTKQQSTHPRPVGPVMLALGSGYLSRDGAARVRMLQRRLTTAGFSPGPIDGRYGPLTEQAVEDFQTSHALQVDGIAGPLTLAALRNPSLALYPGAGYTGPGSGRVRALQRSLAKAGFLPGPIDGRYGPLTEHAVTRFEVTHGLKANGIAGPRTLAELGHQQRIPNKTTRLSHPAGSNQQANRPSRRGPVRSPVSQRPGRVPSHQKVVPAAHSTSSPPLGLVALLIALAVALALAAMWFAHRRRNKRFTDVDAATNGASRSDPGDAIAAHINNTTPNPTPTPEQTLTTDPDPAEPTADGAFSHALLLEEHGDQEGAIAAYERADQLGHAAAAANLGVLLEQQGEQTAAEASYRRADRRGDANGAFNLAVLLEERGDQAGALRAYERADQLGHAAAAANLGVLLEQQGEQTAAEASYRRADQRGDANGAFNLATLLEERGDQAGALRAYQRAGQLGHPEIAEMARAAAVQLTRHEQPTTAGTGGGHDGS